MAFDLRRRKFICTLGGAALAWPLAARAQQPAAPVIGLLGGESPEAWSDRLRAFRQGLSENGYVEGSTVAIEYRWAQNQFDRLPALAADLVRRGVAVIAVPGGTPGALAAKAATSTIPIVFLTGGDPVQLGLVASLNRPGGNLTGVTTLAVELGQKQLELVHELKPAATSIALLVNPTNPALAESTSKNLRAAAVTLGLQLHVLHASTEREIDAAFAELARISAGALVIGADAFFIARRKELAALAIRYAVPAISQFREFAAAGGLMSYGANIPEALRQVGAYSGRILKGEKPADLPVIEGTKLELFINVRTAKTLGLTFPITLLGRADEVIE